MKKAEDVTVRITGPVNVNIENRPRIGGTYPAKKLSLRTSNLKHVYWIPDQQFGKHGVIVYSNECKEVRDELLRTLGSGQEPP